MKLLCKETEGEDVTEIASWERFCGSFLLNVCALVSTHVCVFLKVCDRGRGVTEIMQHVCKCVNVQMF